MLESDGELGAFFGDRRVRPCEIMKDRWFNGFDGLVLKAEDGGMTLLSVRDHAGLQR